MVARKRKCRCCRKWFAPDYRNTHHQRYCPNEVCQAASKRRSQWRWLRKNPTYHRDQGDRVRVWRARHPHYRPKRRSTLRVRLDIAVFWYPDGYSQIRARAMRGETGALQDLWLPEAPVTIQLMPYPDRTIREIIVVSPAPCYKPSPYERDTADDKYAAPSGIPSATVVAFSRDGPAA